MDQQIDIKILWQRAKPLLLPYEGMASQIHVLDLPHCEVDHAIECFANPTEKLTVTTLDGYTFDIDTAPPLDASNRAKIVATLHPKTYHVIRGFLDLSRVVSLWIDPNEGGRTFDAELVFWADHFFPEGQDEERHMASFADIAKIAEGMRRNNPSSECVLSASSAGYPRKERDEAWTLFW